MNEVATRFEYLSPAGSELPALITPDAAGELLPDALPRLRTDIDAIIARTGGVLLRGFEVPALSDFRSFAEGFGQPLLSYKFGSTPRTAIGGGVYTSTEYPAHQAIPLHSEQSYAREWPMKIWFHCTTVASEGGATPIADNRNIYRRMPERIRECFAPGILYVRNYGDFDVPWQQVFNTDHRHDVETYCRSAGIRWEWLPDGGLRTTQLCQAIATHPRSREPVWFNQAHLFHVSNLQPEVRESLEECVGADNMPRNTYFADGTPIPDALFDDVRAVLDSESVSFGWQAGDVLMLDNMLVAHARAPFKGSRKVVVAMADPYSESAMATCEAIR